MQKLLLHLAKSSIKREFSTSTTRLSSEMGCSQQTVSRQLRLLEMQGMIDRTSSPRGVTIKLSKKGLATLRETYAQLKSVFQSQETLKGRVAKGIREGKYYMDMYSSRFQKLLGYKPFSGTLNLEVSQAERDFFISGLPLREISEFDQAGRSFGTVYFAPIKINGKIDGAILLPARATHPQNIIEIISRQNLRQALGLKDGDTIIISTA